MAVTAARVFLMAASEFQAKENRAPRVLAWSSGPGFPETVSSVAAYGDGPRALSQPGSGGLPASPAYAGVPLADGPDVAHRHRHRADPSHLVPVGHLPWNALLPRRLVLDQERRHDTLRGAGDREHPAELVSVRPDARQRLRVVDSHASLTECRGVAPQVVSLHAEVHQAAALLKRRPPAGVGAPLVGTDQLRVTTLRGR